jgi:outer membrane protein with beta-barrel domain
MRHEIPLRALLSTIFLFSCSALWAADPSADRWHVSILASEIPTSQAQPWDDTHAGVSVGVAYTVTPQWDVELTAARQSHTSPYTRFFYFAPSEGVPGTFLPATEFHEYRVMPLDLSVTRHFLTEQAIAPYVRAGVRYVDAPDDPGPTFTIAGIPPYPSDIPGVITAKEGFGFRDRTSVQAGAGVRVRLTPRTAFRAEVTRLLRSEQADFDPLTRVAVGVSWLF